MKTTIAIVALAGLAALPAWAQQGTSNPPWQRPGDPLAAAQTTREYVPNRDVVAAVQQRLNQLGYSTAVTGNYDANLRNNVLRFQSETGLRPTGEVDLSTIGALGIDVEPVGGGPRVASASPPPMPQEPMRPLIAYDQILERDQHMTSPQTRHQSTQLENTAGVTVETQNLQIGELPPGLPPGQPPQNLGLY